MGPLDSTRLPGCGLCDCDGGIVVARTDKLRVIRAEEALHPAFYRVVWQSHVAEWTDLAPADRALMMQAVERVETVLREQLHPTKINLASLGNVVPHLHWHVIARFEGDAHWPAPLWSAPQRAVANPASLLALPLKELDALMGLAFEP